MSHLKWKIIANFAGQAWDRLIGVVCIPFYLKFLGVEAYGLVGFAITLFQVFSIFNFGLGKTLNRELAKPDSGANGDQDKRDLLRTLEVIFWIVALVIGLVMQFLAPHLSRNWLNLQSLSPSQVEHAIRISGLILVFQLTANFYMEGLRGLQRQVLLNWILIATRTLEGPGAVVIIWLVDPTIGSFFSWLLLVALIRILSLAWCLWKLMPAGMVRPAFKKMLMVRVWRFTVSFWGSSLMGVLIFQADKIILSKLLPLEVFGYYMLASSMATLLFAVDYPIVQAVFPHIVQLVEVGQKNNLTEFYHRICQVISVAVMPMAMVTAFFSQELLWLWTRNPHIAEKTSIILTILVVGGIFSVLADMPVNLLVAKGWPHLVLYVRLVLALLFIPGLIFMTSRYGAVGAALALSGYYGLFLLLVVTSVHRFLLQGEIWRWFWEDVGLPFLAASLVGVISWWIIPTSNDLMNKILLLGLIFLAASALAVLLTPQVRVMAYEYLSFGVRLGRVFKVKLKP